MTMRLLTRSASLAVPCLALLLAGALPVLTGCPLTPPNDNGGSVDDGGGDGTGDGNGDGTADGNGDGTADGDGDGTTDGDGDGDGTTDGDGDGDGTGDGGGGGDGDGTGDGGGAGDGDGTGDGGGGSGGGGDNDDDGTPNPIPTRVERTRIVQSGDAVPGQPDGAAFTAFSNPIIDADGRVAFWAAYSGGRGAAGLYIFDGELRRVLDDDPQTRGSPPGAEDDEFFGEIAVSADGSAPPFTWGAGGRLIFRGDIVAPNSSGNPVLRTRGLFRWRASDGNMIRVLEMYQFAAVFSDIGRDSSGNPTLTTRFFSPLVNDDGVVVFQADYVGFTSGRSLIQGTGIFATNGVETIALADERLSPRGSVPGQGARATFDAFAPRVSIDPAGNTLMQSAYNGGVGDHGVYRMPAADDSLVRELDNSGATFEGLAPGTVVGVEGEPFDAIAIGRGGHVAVQTTLSVNGDAHDAVLLRDGSRWRELASSTGEPASALLSGVNGDGACLVLVAGAPHLAGPTGSARNLAAALPAGLSGRTLEWPATVGAINRDGRCLIHFDSAAEGGEPRAAGLALWSGEQLLIVADARTSDPEASVAQITTSAAAGSDYVGRCGALNDADEGAFRVVRQDATQALYLVRGLR